MISLDEYRARLSERGLGRFADHLCRSALTSIRLLSRPLDPKSLSNMTTRIGGAPDLPVDFEWPTFKGVPQSFIAQVNLEEVAALDVDKVLPPTGLLSFFYDANQSIWGWDPADRGGWHVTYSPPRTQLQRSCFPADLAETARFQSVALSPTTELTFAPNESSLIERLGLTFDERFKYSDALGEPDDPDAWLHQLLGNPVPHQGSMEDECQLASHGISAGTKEGWEDPRVPALLPGAVDWRLLLQIDSDDAAGMMWGDVGRLYYWIRGSDLAERRFDQSWLILQCG